MTIDHETRIPTDYTGKPRPDWVGGGRWRNGYGDVIDFDAGTYCPPCGVEKPLASTVKACAHLERDGWTRIDEPARPVPVDFKGTPRPDWVGLGVWRHSDDGGEIHFDRGMFRYVDGDEEPMECFYSAEMAAECGYTRVDISDAPLRVRKVEDGERPSEEFSTTHYTEPLPAGFTRSDMSTPAAFDARAYALRLARERREFDSRTAAYQTPWPQEEIDAAHERARLARIADEIAKRT